MVRFFNKQLAIYISFIAILLAITEIGSYALLILGKSILGDTRRLSAIYAEQTVRILELLNENGQSHREVLDNNLGWRYRPGYQKGEDIINSQGLRSGRNYALKPEAGVLRIAAFGDSFVYGNEVGTSDAWPSQMEEACPQLEVLNYGVGGYGVDQAYLRYASEGAQYAPDIVLIGFVSDDIRRLVNVYRRFIDDREWPLFKPRYILESDELHLIPNPFPDASDYLKIVADPSLVTRVGRYDEWYQPVIYENPLYDLSSTIRLSVAVGTRIQRKYFNRYSIWEGERLSAHSEAFKIQVALFKKFADSVRYRHAQPQIVFFPTKDDIVGVRSGKVTAYALLALELDRLGIPYIDVMDGFSQKPQEAVDSWFMPGGHYSQRGNQIVSERVLKLVCGSSSVK